MLLAAEQVTPGVDLLGQYGPLGVLVAVAVVFFRVAYKQQVDRGDRLEAALIDRALPAIDASNAALQEVTQLLRQIQTEQREDRIRRETRG